MEERTALSGQISMAAFLAVLPKCLVGRQFSLVKPKEQHSAALCLLMAQQGAVYARCSAKGLFTFEDIFKLFFFFNNLICIGLSKIYIFDSLGEVSAFCQELTVC